MDKEKFEQAKNWLEKVLRKKDGYTYYKEGDKISDIDEIILAKFDDLIIDAARELVAVADEREEKPVKSEMPCNCKPKTLQDIIEEAKAELTDSKTFAATVFRVDN